MSENYKSWQASIGFLIIIASVWTLYAYYTGKAAYWWMMGVASVLLFINISTSLYFEQMIGERLEEAPKLTVYPRDEAEDNEHSPKTAETGENVETDTETDSMFDGDDDNVRV